MFVCYYRAEPTEYTRVSVNGKAKKKGTGISGLFIPSMMSFEMVSTAVTDRPFIFKETTSDSQEVSLQGGIVYKVTEPDILLDRYNMSINPLTKDYLSDGLEKMDGHISYALQHGARNIVQAVQLEKLLTMNDEMSSLLMQRLHDSDFSSNLGISLNMLYFSAITPRPDIAKALEAGYRESLLQRADEAIFARRAIAVEKERAIQENEMQTKVDVEKRRKDLVELQAHNTLREAEARAQATQKELTVYDNSDPSMLIARAIYELGKNAGKIENLSITPDIVNSFLQIIRKA